MPDDASARGLLEPVEAAIRLGLSPELLFHYARRPTRTVTGAHRLRSTTVDGRSLFSALDLDEFDARLGEPRSAPGQDRARFDPVLTIHLKVEAGGACGRCGSGVAVETAHIVPYAETRSNHHRNLVRLCSACHGEYDLGALARSEVEALKARLVREGRERLLVGGRTASEGMPPTRPLYGRTEELGRLVAFLRSARSVSLRGVGGIGKTQLLLHALRAAQTGRPCVWVALDSVTSEAVLRGKVAAAAGRIRRGEPLEALSAARACVVLDGAERAGCDPSVTVELVEALLSDGLDVQVVVTSQAASPEVAFDAELRLGRLDRAASARLLPTPRRAPDFLPRLLEVGDGHPLTLRILAALLRHFESGRDVLARLTDRPDLPIQVPGRSKQGPGSSLDLCLGVAISALGNAERRALRVLAQFPAGLATRIHDLTALGMADSDVALAELIRWHLVEDHDLWDARLLTMLSPVRAFVRRAVCDTSPTDLADVRRRVSFCVAMLVEGTDQDMIHGGRSEDGVALLDRELPNVLHVADMAVQHAPDDPGYLHIATSLAGSLQT